MESQKWFEKKPFGWLVLETDFESDFFPDHIRPRVHSLPEKAYNPRACDDLYRLRAFSITHKGVVNRGDSIISRRSRSNTSVNSSR
ncbi:hypothetical protein PV326_006426 [Microctonus aethiopoides]|nr:hypothetical protein PV326_006426 [Microctonus aethiopoides]